MLDIFVADMIYFDYSKLIYDKPTEFYSLLRLFTYENPEYKKKMAMGFYTNDTPEYIQTFNMDDKTKRIGFGRGSLKKLLKHLKGFGIEYKLFDKRLTLPEILYPWSKVVLREEQKALILDLIKAKNGIGIAPTSFGKSISALMLIKALKQPAMIIVHTEFLQKQWIKEATNPDLFNMPKELIGGCGGIFSGKPRLGQLNICLYQSLTKPNTLKIFRNSVGCAIIDEIQKGPIDALSKVIQTLPAKYLLGVTANEARKDGKEFITYDIVGERVHVAEEKESASKIPAYINLIYTGHEDEDYEWDKQYTSMITRTALNQERNTLILQRAFSFIANKKIVLIFVERKEQAFLLQKALVKKGITCEALVGPVTEKHIKTFASEESKEFAKNYDYKLAYDRVKTLAEQKKISVIIGTQKAEVGLSIRTIDHAIITTPVALSILSVKDRMNQMIGRVERKYGDELEKIYGEKPIPSVDILIDEIKGFNRMRKNIVSVYGNRVSVINLKK